MTARCPIGPHEFEGGRAVPLGGRLHVGATSSARGWAHHRTMTTTEIPTAIPSTPLQLGDPHLADLAGYAACGYECATEEAG